MSFKCSCGIEHASVVPIERLNEKNTQIVQLQSRLTEAEPKLQQFEALTKQAASLSNEVVLARAGFPEGANSRRVLALYRSEIEELPADKRPPLAQWLSGDGAAVVAGFKGTANPAAAVNPAVAANPTATTDPAAAANPAVAAANPAGAANPAAAANPAGAANPAAAANPAGAANPAAAANPSTSTTVVQPTPPATKLTPQQIDAARKPLMDQRRSLVMGGVPKTDQRIKDIDEKLSKIPASSA